MRSSGLLLALALATAAAAGESPREPNGAARSPKDAVLEKIVAVTKLKTLTRGAVAKALGMKLKFRHETENEVIPMGPSVVAHGAPGSTFALIDLRGEGEPDAFLAVDVSSSLAITGEDLERLFGRETGTHHPDHHSPPDSPWYYVYVKPKEQLKFGMKPGMPAVLVEVIVDRTDSR